VADLSELGTVIFSTVVIIELLLVTFITPAFTAGAITGERERETYETLRATLLPARKIVSGKLLSALTYMGLLILAAVPLESLAFMLGGVVLEELLVALVILLVTAIAFASMGIFFSSLARSTLVATVLSYGTTLLVTLGMPVILLFVATILIEPIVYGYGSTPFNTSITVQIVLIYTIYVLGNLSPVITAIITKIILIEESSLWYFEVPLGSGSPSVDLPIPSGWLIYTALYLLLSVILLALTVWRVKRQEIQ
jgi:ABC-type transport system involved in multi-copper enzyme maturation permease subunit